MSRLVFTSVVCLPSLFMTIAMADAPLRLNELRLEQPGADNDEYIEIAGAFFLSTNSMPVVAPVVVK